MLFSGSSWGSVLRQIIHLSTRALRSRRLRPHVWGSRFSRQRHAGMTEPTLLPLASDAEVFPWSAPLHIHTIPPIPDDVIIFHRKNLGSEVFRNVAPHERLHFLVKIAINLADRFRPDDRVC